MYKLLSPRQCPFKTQVHCPAFCYLDRLRKKIDLLRDNGQLRVINSSERFKMDIKSQSTLSEKLSRLHPVSYYLKADPVAWSSTA